MSRVLKEVVPVSSNNLLNYRDRDIHEKTKNGSPKPYGNQPNGSDFYGWCGAPVLDTECMDSSSRCLFNACQSNKNDVYLA